MKFSRNFGNLLRKLLGQHTINRDNHGSHWRSQHPVLVAEAQTVGSIAVIRSLGRAGYPVHACAERADALGFMSSYASAIVQCPLYESRQFIPWLREYVQTHKISTIIPSEGLLLAIRPVFAEFADQLPIRKNQAVVYAGMSKFDLFEKLSRDPLVPQLAEHLPPLIVVHDVKNLPSTRDLERLGTPIYIKTDGSYGVDPTISGAVYRCNSSADTIAIITNLRRKFRKFILQGHVSGQGVGVFFLLRDGNPIASFMHKRIHEVPHTGGVSSFRASWFHQAIHDDALKKIRCLGWEGVAMMEYRWDSKTDQFYLMEMNGRFWGSLHLALYAGVDFPTMLVDLFHGRVPATVADYRRGVYCRLTFPKEVEYVWSRLKDCKLSWWSRLWPIFEFLGLCVNPCIYSDLSFPGDSGLYWESMRRFIRLQLGYQRTTNENYQQ